MKRVKKQGKYKAVQAGKFGKKHIYIELENGTNESYHIEIQGNKVTCYFDVTGKDGIIETLGQKSECTIKG